MPIFTYKCPVHGTFEELQKHPTGTHPCPEDHCRKHAVRVIERPSLKPDGAYSYRTGNRS